MTFASMAQAIVENIVLPEEIVVHANAEIVNVLTFVSDSHVFIMNVYDNAMFPIFCANEIGDMLGIHNPRTNVSKVKVQHRRVLTLNNSDQNGLTLRGLCTFVSSSNKDKAKIFTSLLYDFLLDFMSSANALAASCLQLTIERDTLVVHELALIAHNDDDLTEQKQRNRLLGKELSILIDENLKVVTKYNDLVGSIESSLGLGYKEALEEVNEFEWKARRIELDTYFAQKAKTIDDDEDYLISARRMLIELNEHCMVRMQNDTIHWTLDDMQTELVKSYINDTDVERITGIVMLPFERGGKTYKDGWFTLSSQALLLYLKTSNIQLAIM